MEGKMGWSDLPSDLVISIASRLWEAGDYLRFRAVCKSWKSAVRGFRPSFFPWLAVIRYSADGLSNGVSFISHVDKVYKGHLPCDSFHYSGINKDGLMISVHKDGEALVLSPLTGGQLHHLPSFYTSFDSTMTGNAILADNLSAFTLHCTEENPIINEDSEHDYDNGHLILATATPGDDRWSVINLTLRYGFDAFRDIVFHEADHKFYAVDRKGKLLSFCLTRRDGKTIFGEVSTLSKGREDRSWFVAHLVSYGSNLLLVAETPSWKEKFEILEYCPDADTWIGMTSIDLGTNSLFIDYYGAKLLPLPQGEEGTLRRNCIYFIDHEHICPPPDQLAKKQAREEEERKHIYIVHT